MIRCTEEMRIEVKNTRFALTGATGFLGGHVLSFLKDANADTVMICRSGTEASKGEPKKNIIKYKYDELEKSEVVDDLKGRTLIHCAWFSVGQPTNLEHLTHHLPFQIDLVARLARIGFSQLVLVGSCFEFGLRYGPQAPESIVAPITPYAVAKVALSQYLRSLYWSQGDYVRSNAKFKWVRLFYFFGPNQHPNAIIPQLERVLSAGSIEFKMSLGEQLLDYLPVEQVAELLVASSTSFFESGVLHIGRGEPIALRRFVESYIRNRSQPAQINLQLGAYRYRKEDSIALWSSKPGISFASWEDMATSIK